MMQYAWKIIETLAYGYLTDSTQRELYNEYHAAWLGLDGFRNLLRFCAL